MEKEGHIKSYKSVSKSNRKVFILSTIEPSVDVTGGLTGATGFDADKITHLCQDIEAYVNRSGTVTHRELIVFINQNGTLSSDQ